jgi:hypothetical protein
MRMLAAAVFRLPIDLQRFTVPALVVPQAETLRNRLPLRGQPFALISPAPIRIFCPAGEPPRPASGMEHMKQKLLLIAGLILAAATLSGCVIEPGYGYHHHGWWGWHHDRG